MSIVGHGDDHEVIEISNRDGRAVMIRQGSRDMAGITWVGVLHDCRTRQLVRGERGLCGHWWIATTRLDAQRRGAIERGVARARLVSACLNDFAVRFMVTWRGARAFWGGGVTLLRHEPLTSRASIRLGASEPSPPGGVREIQRDRRVLANSIRVGCGGRRSLHRHRATSRSTPTCRDTRGRLRGARRIIWLQDVQWARGRHDGQSGIASESPGGGIRAAAGGLGGGDLGRPGVRDTIVGVETGSDPRHRELGTDRPGSPVGRSETRRGASLKGSASGSLAVQRHARSETLARVALTAAIALTEADVVVVSEGVGAAWLTAEAHRVERAQPPRAAVPTVRGRADVLASAEC